MTEMIDLVERAGLTGRGGAAFPTAVKLRAAAQHDAELIVNACDGEWGAAKDGWVVHHHLDEVVAAAERISGGRYRIAAHRDSPTSTRVRAAGRPLLEVPPRYVSSEESALAALAAGGPARPLMRLAPITSGVRTPSGRRVPPTLVLNAETVWRIEQICRWGPDWFRTFGTREEPGPRLVTITAGVRRPGVYESAAGMPVSALLDLAGVAVPTELLWLNGLSGGYLPTAHAARARWSGRGLQPYGLRVGAGVVAVIDARTDFWAMVLDATDYAVGESAGQCGPCMFGLPAVVQDLRLVVGGEADRDDRRRLAHRLRLLRERGACRHPDGVAGFIESALRVTGHRLPAGITAEPVPAAIGAVR